MPAPAAALSVGPYAVDLADSGSGQALLYLHGFDGPIGESPFVAALSAQHRVIRPTHPGFSGSECPRPLHSMHNVAIYYDGILTALGVDSADVVGHSMGAMFAAELAALAPSRVRTLTLVAPLGIWFDSDPVPDVLSAGGSFLNRMLWADPDNPLGINGLSPIDRAANLATAGNYLWPLPDRGLRERIFRLTMPVLLMRGEMDGLVTAGQVEAWRRLLPGSRLETIAGAGHYPMLEQPDVFVETVRGFTGQA